MMKTSIMRRTLIPVLLFAMGGLHPAVSQAYEPVIDPHPEVIDLGNATVRFQVKFLGMARVIGYFDRFIGKRMHQPDSETGSVDMRIEVSSINTSDDARDEFLRGPTFFNAERYPQITFLNSQLIYGEHGLEQISGDLSLHGMTRTVTFDVEPVKTEEGDDNGEIQAKLTINRSDYGLNSMTPIISDQVEIIIAMRTNS